MIYCQVELEVLDSRLTDLCSGMWVCKS